MTERTKNWTASMSVGVVIRRTPGITKWVKWHTVPVAVLPGAEPADWKELRREGEAVEYHAATVPVELHRAEVEAYLVSLNMTPSSVFVILDRDDDNEIGGGYRATKVTASAYEAQDFLDSGESLVESVPMPPVLAAWIDEFIREHYEEEAFVKRRRDKKRIDLKEDGVGDPRVAQEADVYRAPASLKKRWTN